MSAVLITNKGGRSGSWQIRGEQLGAAMGAQVQPQASAADLRGAGVVVLVKRPTQALVDQIRASGRPWVWDVVDAWPQPCDWSEAQAIAWLRDSIALWKPAGMVFGSPQMQRDAAFEGPSLVLPHHSWQRYVDRQPVVRQSVQVVGYEGAEAYLGRWRPLLKRECARRGWALQINGDMTQADIGVALRDGGGYPADAWKPGTKLSNLHALGIPALCSPEQGARHVAAGCEFWIRTEADLIEAFERLTDLDCRMAISASMRDAMLTVEHCAWMYRNWLWRNFNAAM